jgi:hypothetical protein
MDDKKNKKKTQKEMGGEGREKESWEVGEENRRLEVRTQYLKGIYVLSFFLVLEMDASSGSIKILFLKAEFQILGPLYRIE